MAAPRPRRRRPGHRDDRHPPVCPAHHPAGWSRGQRRPRGGGVRPVARAWAAPLSLLFIDGGHGAAVAWADFTSWAPKVAVGGTLAVHDVFADPGEGGQVPYEIFCQARASGEWEETAAVGSLRLLQRTQVRPPSRDRGDRRARPTRPAAQLDQPVAGRPRWTPHVRSAPQFCSPGRRHAISGPAPGARASERDTPPRRPARLPGQPPFGGPGRLHPLPVPGAGPSGPRCDRLRRPALARPGRRRQRRRRTTPKGGG